MTSAYTARRDRALATLASNRSVTVLCANPDCRRAFRKPRGDRAKYCLRCVVVNRRREVEERSR